jgi:hypothetical protein
MHDPVTSSDDFGLKALGIVWGGHILSLSNGTSHRALGRHCLLGQRCMRLLHPSMPPRPCISI